MKFIIGVKEVWEQCYEVEAETSEDAIEKLDNFFMFDTDSDKVKMKEDDFELSYVLESDEWTVTEKS